MELISQPLLVGALLIGGFLHLLGFVVGRPPDRAIAVIAVSCALIALIAAVSGLALPVSEWQVPRAWRRFGPVRYSAAFGAVLGVGIFTAIPSTGFYVLLAWALSSASLLTTSIVFGAYGIARGAPLAVVAILARVTTRDPFVTLDRFSRRTDKLVFPEAVVLVAIGILGLTTGLF